MNDCWEWGRSGWMASYETQAMSEFEGQVLADLSVLKSQMAALLGEGQPGRIAALEERVECHERDFQRAKGFAAAVGALFTILHFLVQFVRSRY
jgi:hypothetical protein